MEVTKILEIYALGNILDSKEPLQIEDESKRITYEAFKTYWKTFPKETQIERIKTLILEMEIKSILRAGDAQLKKIQNGSF